MTATSAEIRTYTRQYPVEHHDFVQIVLPVSGKLCIDVAGRQQELSRSRGAFIHAGVAHAQQVVLVNHSLVVDIREATIPEQVLERFVRAPFVDISPAMRQLTALMSNAVDSGSSNESFVQPWSSLLFGSLGEGRPDFRHRIRTLASLIAAEPFNAWTIESMASMVALGQSRLHALFTEEMGISPHRFASQRRLEKICLLLRETAVPIAEIALKAGFSDQTALTRAMRSATGQTPAAYRQARGGASADDLYDVEFMSRQG